MNSTHTLRLPIKHAQDWASRYDGDDNGATFGVMDPSNTGDIDYRPPARTLLRALDRLGVKYTRGRSYTVTLGN